jgi:hypothetical protein
VKKYNLTEENIDIEDISNSIVEAEKAWDTVMGNDHLSHDVKADFDDKDGEDNDPKLEELRRKVWMENNCD